MGAPTVIYLAAGRGSRLGELCDDRPKALIEVAGRTLADRAFLALREAGFERIVAVTGHAAEKLDLDGIETRFNPHWADQNNVVSLWQVRDLVRGGCAIVNSDLLFEPQLAQRLRAAQGTALLVDEQQPVDEESMKVTLQSDGTLDSLHKSLALDAAAGEYVGLTRVAAADGPRLAEILDEFVAAGNVQVYYEDALAALARERPVRIERIGGLAWVEIDDAGDLARAEATVAPVVDRALANLAPVSSDQQSGAGR